MQTMTTSVPSIPLAGLQPCGLAWDGEAWWHADGTAQRVYRLDPLDGAIRREFQLRGAMGGTAWGGGYVWQAITSGNKILKLDPGAGGFIAAIGPGTSLVGVTWAVDLHLVGAVHQTAASILLHPVE